MSSSSGCLHRNDDDDNNNNNNDSDGHHQNNYNSNNPTNSIPPRPRVPSPSSVRRQYMDDQQRLQWKKAAQATLNGTKTMERRRGMLDDDDDDIDNNEESSSSSSSSSLSASLLSWSLFAQYFHAQQQQQRNNLRPMLGPAWDHPSYKEMKRRLLKRRDMIQETMISRTNINNSSSITTTVPNSGRSILHVLHDRSIFGSASRVLMSTKRRTLQGKDAIAGKRKATINQPVTSIIFPFPASHTLTKELRTYMEYCSVTRYQSSYFSHLGGMEEDEEQEQGEETAEAASATTTANQEQQQDLQDPDSSDRISSSTTSRSHRRRLRPTSSTAVSTISIAFSPNGQTQASTHGDHTVKITSTNDGRLLQTLHGHPRTPWTVKYHPTNNQLLASGCLGHQVRVWNWIQNVCLQMIRLEFAIISLSFHPTGKVLAIANGTRLHFWANPAFANDSSNDNNDHDHPNSNNSEKKKRHINDKDATTSSSTTATHGPTVTQNVQHNPNYQRSTITTVAATSVTTGNAATTLTTATTTNQSSNHHQSGRPNQPRGVLTEVEQRHMLRCVHFLPHGKTIIVGGVNPHTTTTAVAAANNSTHNNDRNRRGGGSGANQNPGTTTSTAGTSNRTTSTATTAGGNNGGGGISGGGMSFYLRLWDFDLQAALYPGSSHHHNHNSGNGGDGMGTSTGLRRRAISNPRTFVQRALLYNDGGFDVSPDGKTLCACAEYWLPDGIDNAAQLVRDQVQDEEDQDDEDYSIQGEDKDDESEPFVVPQQDESRSRRNTSSASDASELNDGGTVQSHSSSPPRPPLPHSTPTSAASATAASSSIQGSSGNPALQQHRHHPMSQNITSIPPMTSLSGLTPMTPPPNATQAQFPLSPPSPPGRRFAGGLRQQQISQEQATQVHVQRNLPHVQNHPQILTVGQPSTRSHMNATNTTTHNTTTGTTIHPLPVPPGIYRPTTVNPLATPHNTQGNHGMASQSGRFVPHVVTISLDTTPFWEITEVPLPGAHGGSVMAATIPTTATTSGRHSTITTATTATTTKQATLGIPGRGVYSASQSNGGSAMNAIWKPPPTFRTTTLRPRLGQLMEACPLDGAKASAVTCVKFSPSTDFCLIGYGVREPILEDPHGHPYHPVTALYRIRGGMTHVSTMLSGDDDVNIARFHPDSGYGFVYGTKQGRVRVMSPRPWNYYDC